MGLRVGVDLRTGRVLREGERAGRRGQSRGTECVLCSQAGRAVLAGCRPLVRTSSVMQVPLKREGPSVVASSAQMRSSSSTVTLGCGRGGGVAEQGGGQGSMKADGNGHGRGRVRAHHAAGMCTCILQPPPPHERSSPNRPTLRRMMNPAVASICWSASPCMDRNTARREQTSRTQEALGLAPRPHLRPSPLPTSPAPCLHAEVLVGVVKGHQRGQVLGGDSVRTWALVAELANAGEGRRGVCLAVRRGLEEGVGGVEEGGVQLQSEAGAWETREGG